MTIKVYKDASANAIFLEDANGAQFLNTLQATAGLGSCSIEDVAKGISIATDIPYSDFVDESDSTYGSDEVEVCNALNAMFNLSGTSQNQVPAITSSLSISCTEGDTINYELVADYGVGYEWDLSAVSGITTVEGNPRKLIGGSSLASGTYNIPIKAINYNGEDSKTIVLTVDTPPFSNTKSVNFENQDYLGANAALLSTTLGRTGNGSGSSDAWSIGLWFKGSTANQGQTIFYFGDSDAANGGYIQLMQINSGGSKSLRLRYGSNFNCLKMQTQNGSIVPNVWQHIFITYSGGTTGASSGSISDYYSRFKIYIDGSLATRNDTHNNYGYTGGLDADNLRVGRFSSGNYMRGCRVDELAVFDSDQSANVSDVYGGGTPFDLNSLTVQPEHWWRMGDGDTYPVLQDSGASANCHFVMYNMNSGDIVNDTP
jgi:hypothetical protein